MFDIGLTELLLLGVVALIVIGPERLPHAARMTGAWIGKIRRTFASLQVELEREVDASEIKARLKQEAEGMGLHDITGKLADEIKEATSDMSQLKAELESDNIISSNDTGHADLDEEESIPNEPVKSTKPN